MSRPLRVLCAWELGQGLGHTGRLDALARWLAPRGHTVTHVLRDITGRAAVPGQQVLQAPASHAPERPGMLSNYSEILLAHGFGNPALLQALVRAWGQLFELLKTDVVVADHAPVALLAARALGVHAAAVGTGFTLPPCGAAMPLLRPWLPQMQAQAAAADTQALQVMNHVLQVYQRPPLAQVSGLLAPGARWLCSWPELDAYEARQGDAYLGPYFDTAMGQAAQWPAGAGPKVFVYLRLDHREFVRVLELLRLMPVRALVCAPGIRDADRQAFESPRLHILATPLRLDSLGDVDLALNYGSAAMTAAMLLAGIPQLMLPVYIEQLLHARRVEALGAGRVFHPDAPPQPLGALIAELLGNASYRNTARRFAQAHAHYSPAQVVETLGHAVESLGNR